MSENLYSIVPIEVLYDKSLTGLEVKMLICLLSFRNKKTNLICPSINKIAERMRLNDVPKVSKITKSLCEKGWLKKSKKHFHGANSYEFCVPLCDGKDGFCDDMSDGDDGENVYEITPNAVQETFKTDQKNDQFGQNDQLGQNSQDQFGQNDQDQFGQNDQVQFGQNDQHNKQYNKQNNKYSSKSLPTPTCPHEKIIEIYHGCLPELPRVILSSWKNSSRAKDLKARWRQDPEYQKPEFWNWYFSRVKTLANGFYLGNNDRGWTADIGWLLKKANFDKTVEKLMRNLK